MATLTIRDGSGIIQLLNVTDIGGGVLDTHHIVDDVAAVSSLKTVVSVQQTVTASSAYADGNMVGGKLTFAAAVRTGKTGGTINSVVITDKSNTQAQYDLWIFDTDPVATTITDKTALTINATDLVHALGYVTLTSWSPATSGGAIGIALPDLRFVVASGTSLFGILIVHGTPTYASTSDILVRLVISQD